MKDIQLCIRFTMNRRGLSKKIKSRIEDLSEPLWFPSLTGDLVKDGWNDLKKTCGLEPSTYSTSRVLLQECDDSIKRIYNASKVPIEFLEPRIQQHYSKQGVTFFTRDELERNTAVSSVVSAVQSLEWIPSLMSTVKAFIHSAHLIKPDDDEIDTSFSEPNIPFSIFFTVPSNACQDNSLRVAEAIIHEAMHLQLTLIERAVPLARNNGVLAFSPWRQKIRPAAGVLHGIYVFKVVYSFFELLIDRVQDPAWISFCIERKTRISEELRGLHDFESSHGLTSMGRLLASRLLSD